MGLPDSGRAACQVLQILSRFERDLRPYDGRTRVDCWKRASNSLEREGLIDSCDTGGLDYNLPLAGMFYCCTPIRDAEAS